MNENYGIFKVDHGFRCVLGDWPTFCY